MLESSFCQFQKGVTCTFSSFYPVNIRLDEDVFPLRLQKTSPRRLDQDEYIRLGLTSSRRLQDVFKSSCKNVIKTSSRCLQVVLQKRLQDIFKTSCQDVLKTSLKRLQDVLLRCLQDIFKTFSRRIIKQPRHQRIFPL